MNNEQIKNEFMEVVEGIPEELRDEFLAEVKGLSKTFHSATFGMKEKIRIADIKANYEPFPEDKKFTLDNIIGHLREQLGDRLKYFGAEDDSVYLDEIRKIEPLTSKIENKFYYAHKRDNSVPLISDLIAKKSQKITKRLENFKITDKTTLKEYQQVKSIQQKRKKLPSNLPIPEAE